MSEEEEEEEEEMGGNGVVEVPQTSRKIVFACRYDQWHTHFKRWTFPSVTISPLLDSDVLFLLKDEVRINEKNKAAMPARTRVDAYDRLAIDSAFDEDDELFITDNNNDESTSLKSPSESLLTAIAKAIKELGGSAHPKLTWSAPTDAIWLTQFSTKCLNADEVMLLFDKLSDG